MRHVVTNAIFNAGAFLVVAAVNLAIVPLLIDGYGVTEYGLLALIRLLSPTGICAAADLALPIVATRAVSRHQAKAEHSEMRQTVTAALSLSLVIGVFVSMVLYTASAGLRPDGPLLSWLNIDVNLQDAALAIVAGIVVALPVQFAGTVCQGVLEGRQMFRSIRLAEMISTLLFGALALILTTQEVPFTFIAIGFIGLQSAKAVALIGIVLALLRGPGGWIPTRQTFAALFAQIGVLYASKLVGVLQANAIPLLIVGILGPVGLGTFDAITRIPRFFKIGFGLLNAVIVPVATEREALGKHGHVQALVLRTTRVTAFFAIPAVFVLILHADNVLGFWLGPDFAPHGLFLGIALSSSLLALLTGIAASASVAKLAVVHMVNRLAFGELLLLIVLLLTLLPVLDLAGAFAAMATAACIGYLIRVWIYLPAFGIEGREWWSPLARTATASALPAVFGSLVYHWVAPASVWALAAALSLSSLAALAATYAVWRPTERADLHRLAAISCDMFRRRAPH